MDQIVNFETAKLAKEKGFKLRTNPFGYVTKFYEPKTGSIRAYGMHGRNFKNLIYAPTQTELLKWIRDVHNLHIQISIGTTLEKPVKCWVYFIQNDKGRTIQWNTNSNNVYNSYEESLEVGLLKALELIQ